MDPSLISSLPTDSLYKFMALSGLLVLAISVIIPFYLRNKFKNQLYEVRKHHDLLKLKYKFELKKIFDEIKDKNIIFGKFCEENKCSVTFDTVIEFCKEMKLKASDISSEELNVFKDTLNKISSLEFECEKNIIENDCLTKKVELEHENLKQLYLMQTLGIIISLSLTISGFVFWYTKIQVYLDATIAAG